MKMRLFAPLGVFGLVLVGPAAMSQALITHPADDPNLNTIPKPSANVVGRWNVDGGALANASLVAIDSSHAITTRHQGAGVGAIVEFGGIRYKVSQETPIGNADLRVLELTQEFSSAPANLSAFTPVYTASSVTFGDAVTLGGFGRPRGVTLLDPNNQPYGYLWNFDVNGDTLTDNVNQTPQSFGRNSILGTLANVNVGAFVNDIVVADFDHPGVGLTGEASISEFDSGGGWFIETSPGVWAVAGLTQAFDHQGANVGQPNDRALFSAFNNGSSVEDQDLLFAVDLTTYRSAINSAVPEPGAVSLLAAGAILGLGRRRARARTM
jgi:hypothetical protein